MRKVNFLNLEFDPLNLIEGNLCAFEWSAVLASVNPVQSLELLLVKV